MVTVSGPWTREEMEQFLSAETVPLRLGCRTPADKPWMLSLWYRFDADDERLVCATSADADIVDHARDLMARTGMAFVVGNRAEVMGEAETRAIIVRSSDTSEFEGSKADLGAVVAAELAAELD